MSEPERCEHLKRSAGRVFTGNKIAMSTLRRSHCFEALMDRKLAAILLGLVLFASPALAADQIPDINVLSKRQQKQLQIDVDNFVSSALVRPHMWESDRTVQRWGARENICPMVVGLPREKGEYVLSRFSEIASHARVRLADSECKRPNLSIIVTSDPEKQVKEFTDYAKKHMGGSYRDHVLNTMFKDSKPRPVQAFYNTIAVGADGTLYGGVQMLPAQLGSRLYKTLATQDIVAVVEVVDRRAFNGMSMAQLADYVSMIALARIDQDSDYGRSPTILKLYNASEEAKPTGATDWDMALLDALYKVKRIDTTAESEVQGMVLGSIKQASFKPDIKDAP